MGWRGLDSSGSEYGQAADFCKQDNDPSAYIKYIKFLD
jgi:hypothetical protein